MKKILIIEDDPAILLGLEECLKAEHLEVITSDDGEKGFELARKTNYDLLILDLMLPGINGFDICRELRQAGVSKPILMLTSKSEESDKVLGLELGADDYVTKPFSIRELMARVKALLRRAEPAHENKKDLSEYSFEHFRVDFKKHLLIKGSKQVDISATEVKILKYFIEHEGEVITRNQLLDDVWGYDVFPSTRTVDNYILSLRKIIEPVPSEPVHILTVHKAGYKFVP